MNASSFLGGTVSRQFLNCLTLKPSGEQLHIMPAKPCACQIYITTNKMRWQHSWHMMQRVAYDATSGI